MMSQTYVFPPKSMGFVDDEILTRVKTLLLHGNFESMASYPKYSFTPVWDVVDNNIVLSSIKGTRYTREYKIIIGERLEYEFTSEHEKISYDYIRVEIIAWLDYIIVSRRLLLTEELKISIDIKIESLDTFMGYKIWHLVWRTFKGSLPDYTITWEILDNKLIMSSIVGSDISFFFQQTSDGPIMKVKTGKIIYYVSLSTNYYALNKDIIIENDEQRNMINEDRGQYEQLVQDWCAKLYKKYIRDY